MTTTAVPTSAVPTTAAPVTTVEPFEVDTDHCPPEPAADEPIRIGANGGGFNGSRHIDGLQAAVDEANAAGGIDGRRVELVTAVERQSDSPNASLHLNALFDRGDLHVIVPWGGWPDPTEVAARFEIECVPALFWLSQPAPDAGWVLPGLDDRRADLAVIAEWLAVDLDAEHVVAVPVDWPSEISVARSLVSSLEARGVSEVSLALLDPNATPPRLDVGGVASDSSAVDAVVITTAGAQCADGVVQARDRWPQASIAVVATCEPNTAAHVAAFADVVRPAWLAEATDGDATESSYRTGEATGRAVLAVLAAAVGTDGELTRAGIWQAANRLSIAAPGGEPGLTLHVDGPADRFARESAALEIYRGAWQRHAGVVDADGTTPYTAIDWTNPTAFEPDVRCGDAGGPPRLFTSHWFGEDGRLDPLADIVLNATGIDLGPSPSATLVATGADGTVIELSLALGIGAQCGETYFDIKRGDPARIDELAPPVAIVFELNGGRIATEPVQWPDDFPPAPPFGNVDLTLR